MDVSSGFVIRQETPEDYEAVYELIRSAFLTAEHRDGNEQDLVVALRKGEAFIPQLSLVAQEGEKILGYVLFTRAWAGEKRLLALAPLAVSPKRQRQGIGSALLALAKQHTPTLLYFGAQPEAERFYERNGCRKSLQSYQIDQPETR